MVAMAQLSLLLVLALLVPAEVVDASRTLKINICCKRCCNFLGICGCDCECKEPVPLPGTGQLPNTPPGTDVLQKIPIVKQVTCDTVAEAGQHAFGLALDVMVARANKAGSIGVPPSPREAAALRACFGGVVDNVRFFYGVAPLDKIKLEPAATGALTAPLFNGIPIPVEINIDTDTLAQTFGDTVFFRAQQPKWEDIVHEMIHVEQYYKRGRDLKRLSADYVRGWCEAGFVYEKNGFEVEAYDKEGGCAAPAPEPPPVVVTPPSVSVSHPPLQGDPVTVDNPTPTENPVTVNNHAPTDNPVTAQPTTAFFPQPRHNGKRIDMCLSPQTPDLSCLDEGKSAADMFCRQQGYARMAVMGPLEWMLAENTIGLVNGQECNSFCRAIKDVTCIM